MDGAGFIDAKTITSNNFGELYKADSIVHTNFEPDGDATFWFVLALVETLCLTRATPDAQKKIIRCLSDVLVAAQDSKTGLFAWPSANDKFVDGPYSNNVVRTVREALLEKGFIRLVQKSSKRDGLASIYSLTKHIPLSSLKFKLHWIGPLVEVRSIKVASGGMKRGGKRLPRAQFEPQINELTAEVRRINRLNKKLPMISPDGSQFGPVKRIFNNGNLQSGGRLYGSWQTNKEVQRLAMTIGGEAVCEIDLKASYPNICHGMFGGTESLGSDPYQRIKFVKKAVGEERKAKMRELAKFLVASFVSTGGAITSFPKGRKADGRTISIREEYGLSKKVTCGDLIAQILKAFPTMRRLEGSGKCAMFAESEVFVDAILDLVGQGIPAYPMHDALIVRQKDAVLAVCALQRSLETNLSFVPDLDISFLNEEGQVCSDLAKRPDDLSGRALQQHGQQLYSLYCDSDFNVLEDF
ncbi:hypothetical protein [Falsihalocynthiibacter arcticus]|uniref:Uncharacterized protein n=1 Tax=Falsihalocynthiibacter arcticus TaxID=1579316 RepID=A0A126UWF1_9RHOB|nr:hypothetical protein [Falsihalocynthiibacter arcticus]AML50401.1 hypothetical protein RC74_03195 [Falsihalocynthiibacter arcticus]